MPIPPVYTPSYVRPDGPAVTEDDGEKSYALLIYCVNPDGSGFGMVSHGPWGAPYHAPKLRFQLTEDEYKEYLRQFGEHEGTSPMVWEIRHSRITGTYWPPPESRNGWQSAVTSWE